MEKALPRVLRATRLADPPEQLPTPIQLSAFDGIRIWAEGDELTTVWLTAAETHRLVVPDGGPVNAIVLPLDEMFEARLDAARRLWRALNGRPPGRAYGALPVHTRARHILNLRVHDGKRAGASYREIAGILLSHEPIPPREWRDHHLKHKVRAILRRTNRLISGGYRSLLLYPHGRRATSNR